MNSIKVSLPTNRLYMGHLTVEDEDGVVCFGPVIVDGKSDNAAAFDAGNGSRDPAKAFGDTPCGEFTATIGFVEDTPENRRSFGDPNAKGEIPVLRLQPIEGDTQAWKRQLSEGVGKDMGLMIHGGALNATGQIRPTHGCLRALPGDIPKIVAIFNDVSSFSVSITEKV